MHFLFYFFLRIQRWPVVRKLLITSRERKLKAKEGRWKWQCKKGDDGEREGESWGMALWKKKRNKIEERKAGKGEADWAFDVCDYLSSWSSISKTRYDIKYPQVSKTTNYSVLGEWLKRMCMYVRMLGLTGAAKAGECEGIRLNWLLYCMQRARLNTIWHLTKSLLRLLSLPRHTCWRHRPGTN